MQNLTTNKILLFNKSEQVFLKLFNNSSTKTRKKEDKTFLKIVKKQDVIYPKNILSKNLDILELKSKNIKLYTTIKNIEKFVGEEYAIKYLNGYLEYNKLTLRNLINNI